MLTPLEREMLRFLEEMKHYAGPMTPLGWEQLNNLIQKAHRLDKDSPDPK